MSVMHHSDQINSQFANIQNKELCTLHWGSFSGDSNDVINRIFAQKGAEYYDNG